MEVAALPQEPQEVPRQTRLFEGLEVRRLRAGIGGAGALEVPPDFDPSPDDMIEVRLLCRVVKKQGHFKPGADEDGNEDKIADLKWSLYVEDSQLRVVPQ